MRKLFLTLLACGPIAFLGCADSVREEAQDVREAQQEAAENVAEEREETHDAAREGAENIREEQRELDEAVDDAHRDGDPATP